MTNGDWIRSMSDSELADFLENALDQESEEWTAMGCYNCAYYGTHHQPEECVDCEWENGIFGWLKSE